MVMLNTRWLAVVHTTRARTEIYNELISITNASHAKDISKHLKSCLHRITNICITIELHIRSLKFHDPHPEAAIGQSSRGTCVEPASPASSREAPASSKSKCPISSLASHDIVPSTFTHSFFVWRIQSLTCTLHSNCRSTQASTTQGSASLRLHSLSPADTLRDSNPASDYHYFHTRAHRGDPHGSS